MELKQENVAKKEDSIMIKDPLGELKCYKIVYT
jgi:hypothetical protein